MNLNETIINVIFDAGRGESPVASREAESGKPYGALPVPVRTGYVFAGWYLGETPITAETLVDSDSDVRLVARWAKKKKTDAAPKSAFKKQKIAAIALAIAAVVLVGVLLVVNYGISIYPLQDTWTTEDGVEHSETYYVRKKNGEYGLYNKDGKLMEINEISTKNQQQDSDTLYVVYIAENSGNQYLIDSETGSASRYAVVDYGGDEVLGFRDRVLLFPQITQTNVYSIEVNNQYGKYKFYRDKNGAFCLEGFEDSPAGYSAEGIADLCSACGYTISLRKLDLKSPDADISRLPDGNVDYAAYGLAEIYDENGESVYKPATFTIVKAKYEGKTCSASDTSYTVKVGYKTPQGNGYYMQMEGRDAIYVADTLVKDTVLGPVENMIAPIIIHPMTTSNYLMVRNFVLGMIKGEFSENFDPATENPLVAFSYQELDERLSTVYTGTPYVYPTDFKIMDGYALNDNKVSDMLMQLYQLQADSCVRLGVTKETLAEFGLDKDVHYVIFDSPPTDSSGSSPYNGNMLLIGQKTERDTYYIASFVSDMILEVPASSMSFLEWKASDWYLQYFFQHRIDNVTSLGIQIGDKTYDFALNNLFSYAFYENSKGVMTRISLEKGKVRQGNDGKWIYTDETGRDYTVKLFDFTKGDLYIRLDPAEKGASPIYYSYYKYLITKDRNNDMTMKIIEREADGEEYTTEIDLGSTSNSKYDYRLVYIAEDGEEFDVAGAYNNANGERFSAYYQMPYWEEGTDGKWTRKVTPSLATNLMLRDSNGKLYQIPMASSNMQVSCEQYQGGTKEPTLLDYNTVYTYRTDTGLIETATVSGIKNFRQLFSLFPNYSLESQIDVDAFIERHNMTPDEYIKTVAPYATFTYTVRDMADNMNVLSYLDRDATSLKNPVCEEKVWHDANETHTVVRLYEYSATRSIITIETNGGETVAVFYVLTEYCNTILDAADKLLSGYPINPEGEIVEIK